MITGNEIKNSCRDVRTDDIWSDVIASVFPDVSKERNASIFKGQEFKKAVIWASASINNLVYVLG